MLKNYITIAFRNLTKNKIYSSINIVGLAIGISCCFLILAHVQDELSYDKFHKDSKNIYRVALKRLYSTHTTFYAIIPHSFAKVIEDDYPEVEKTVRLFANQNTTLFRYEDEKGELHLFEEKQFMLADSNFFDVFTVEIIKGDKNTALDGNNSIVITEETAKKYFGEVDPIGKIITSNQTDFKVSAVCENIPENSHFDFDIIAALGTFPFFNSLNFTGFSAYTYLKLKENTNPKQLEAKFPDMVLKYAAPQIEQSLGISYKEYQDKGNGYQYFLQNLGDIHLHSNLEAEMKVNGNITQVYIFISISIFILFLACINFMNLATARSAERAKEVGIRKALGSLKKQLITQFLTESIVISLVSLLIALVIISFALPYFNNLAGKTINIDFSNLNIIAGLIAFSILVGLLAGIYPAFFISSFNPIAVMKGQLNTGGKGALLRNGLVVFQFFISIILITGTLIVYKQMNYIQSTDLGYNKENIVIIEGIGNLGNKLETFKNEVNKVTGVSNVAFSSAMPGQPFFFGSSFIPEYKSEALITKTMVMDEDFQKTMGLEIIEGRGFDKAYNDSSSIILNEAALVALDIQDPIGSKITSKNNDPANNVTYTIVGIAKDFHFQSLRESISPLAILAPSGSNNFGFLAVHINNSELHSSLSDIENLWKEFENEMPFKHTFFEEDLKAQYISDKRFGEVFMVFASLAIIIACVGLFGLAAYTASLKTKEIGVRKVLGASISGIILMLTTKFTKLVLIAFVLAIPFTYYVMDWWLSSFAYKTEMGILPFLLAGTSAFGIAIITVSYQSIKAAIVNPVKSLKSE
ncbi:ABC transporter permease [Chondrinema litorale]|uniref:ABC transporter permease n=1 Tax=Chondrinema litorale TaxID=2994555 RepID=UPI002544556B|nr:ABC transporter permease [Chondrinema litorale]UZR95668.1 ABC transporter permease [Chondrinema litorale]